MKRVKTAADKTKQAAWYQRNKVRLREYKRIWALNRWRKETERSRNKQRAIRVRLRAELIEKTKAHPEPAFCECCGGPPAPIGKKLAFDHDHTTGEFRGWLCSRCNTAIGLLGDCLEGVEKAAIYLAKATLLK